jgi:hypothetical protein
MVFPVMTWTGNDLPVRHGDDPVEILRIRAKNAKAPGVSMKELIQAYKLFK